MYVCGIGAGGTRVCFQRLLGPEEKAANPHSGQRQEKSGPGSANIFNGLNVKGKMTCLHIYQFILSKVRFSWLLNIS